MSDIARPDPSNIPAYLAWLGDQVLEIKQGQRSERLNASQAAQAFGFKKNYFSRAPWRIPGFGKHGTMHTRDEWAYWLAEGEATHRATWDAMTAVERRLCGGQV